MIITRARIVAEALLWRGTPFLWAQSRRGQGCDCKGLIYGIARDLDLPESRVPEMMNQTYRRADPDVLMNGLRATFRQVDRFRPGDILALPVGYRDLTPRHVGIVVDDSRMLHCYGRNVDRVVSVPIGSRRIHSIWTWPSLGLSLGLLQEESDWL